MQPRPVVRSYRRDPLETVLAALGGDPRPRPDGGYLVRCPAHDDGTPSLSLRAGDDGRALLHCHAGCEPAAVVAALGLRLADLFPPAAPPSPPRPSEAVGGGHGDGRTDGHGDDDSPPAAAAAPRPGPTPGPGDGPYLSPLPIDPAVASRPRRWSSADIAAEYIYEDARGQIAGRVVRLAPKGFRQQRPNGRGGWLWGLDGGQLPLYRLPALIAAPEDEVVLIVEGEKDADALARMGLVATTCPGGAGRWQTEFRRYLVNRPVAVLPDNDPPGWNHAAQIARDVFGLASEVRVVALPGVGPKGDVSDWLAGGGTAERLAHLIRAARPVAFTGEWDEPLANLYPYAGKPAALRPVLGPDHGPSPDDDPNGPGGGPLGPVHGPRPAELDLPFTTARDLAEREASATRWVAEPWLAAGAITELDGRAKASGKTTLATHLVRAVLDGRPFLGGRTTPTPVVYLTEQSPPTFREALRRADLLGRDDLSILAWHDAAAAGWPDVVAAAVARAKAVGAGLLVVDTLPQFACLRGDAENNAGAALEAIAPLQAAAGRAGLAVLVLRHERKGGGDVGESGRGSSAFAGAVDVILQLKRPEGNTRPTLRVLSALSRFDETPDELVIELTAAGYVSHGDLSTVVRSQAEDALAAAAPTAEGLAVSLDDLIGLAGDVSNTTARRAVADLLGRERLRRIGTGRRGDPYRYWRPAEEPSGSRHPTVRVGQESNRLDEASMGRPGSVVSSPPSIVSRRTPTVGWQESNADHVDELPANVIRMEDRRAPWEGELGGDAASATVADLPLLADLAAGCVEPETCAELGPCGEGGAPACGPAGATPTQPALRLPHALWPRGTDGDETSDDAGRVA